MEEINGQPKRAYPVCNFDIKLSIRDYNRLTRNPLNSSAEEAIRLANEFVGRYRVLSTGRLVKLEDRSQDSGVCPYEAILRKAEDIDTRLEFMLNLIPEGAEKIARVGGDLYSTTIKTANDLGSPMMPIVSEDGLVKELETFDSQEDRIDYLYSILSQFLTNNTMDYVVKTVERIDKKLRRELGGRRKLSEGDEQALVDLRYGPEMFLLRKMYRERVVPDFRAIQRAVRNLKK